MKVVKFGGSSLGSAENILKAKDIILADGARTFVVVSAPGKAADFPRKITDLLIDTHAQLCYEDSCDSCDTVFGRFEKLSRDLGVDISAELERVREEISINRCQYDFVISRGEYLMAVLFAKVLNWVFLDAANYVAIKKNGLVDEEVTRKNFLKIQKTKCYVMGGFYGRGVDGGVKTFARGGSDYTGAVAAVCLNAAMYENFTDTYGVQTANPAVVKNTQTVSEIDYATLHRLSRAGASVIYPNCLPLLRRHAMPLKVDCTFDAGKKGTLVTAKKPAKPFFSITYETKQNINKDTAEILCEMKGITFSLCNLRTVLAGYEVYLVEFSRTRFRLVSPASVLAEVINLLHSALMAAKSTASL